MASDGPGEDFAKALAKGDFEKAANELKQIKEKLANGQDDREGKRSSSSSRSARWPRSWRSSPTSTSARSSSKRPRRTAASVKEQFDKEMAKLADQAKGLENLKKMAGQLSQGRADDDGQGRHQESRRGPGGERAASSQKMAQELTGDEGP